MDFLEKNKDRLDEIAEYHDNCGTLQGFVIRPEDIDAEFEDTVLLIFEEAVVEYTLDLHTLLRELAIESVS